MNNNILNIRPQNQVIDNNENANLAPPPVLNHNNNLFFNNNKNNNCNNKNNKSLDDFEIIDFKDLQ